jgi:hypothetical protein
MTTKADLVAQCKEENPTMTALINGVETLLSDAEYEAACADWAEMRLIQIADENAKAQAEADKVALLAKLGLTADEFKTLLGDNK